VCRDMLRSGDTPEVQERPIVDADAKSLYSCACCAVVPTLQTGQKFRGDMAAKIEKWQEPPPAKTSKPLPA
jgi:hypothetical protein